MFHFWLARCCWLFVVQPATDVAILMISSLFSEKRKNPSLLFGLSAARFQFGLFSLQVRANLCARERTNTVR